MSADAVAWLEAHFEENRLLPHYRQGVHVRHLLDLLPTEVVHAADVASWPTPRPLHDLESQLARLQEPLPPADPPAPSPLHHPGYAAAAAAFATAYTRAVETPPVEHRLPIGGIRPGGGSWLEREDGDPAATWCSVCRRDPCWHGRGAAYPQVASENPQVECGEPGWLSRAFGRLFGKGAA